MSREKRRFSIGSARSETCAISKQWGVSIWPTTRWLSLSWRRSSVENFTRHARRYRKEENDHEADHATNRAVDHACYFSRWGGVVFEEKPYGKTKRRRSLHLHDASFGAGEGAWEMSNLLHGSRAGHERRGNPGKF